MILSKWEVGRGALQSSHRERLLGKRGNVYMEYLSQTGETLLHYIMGDIRKQVLMAMMKLNLAKDIINEAL